MLCEPLWTMNSLGKGVSRGDATFKRIERWKDDLEIWED